MKKKQLVSMIFIGLLGACLGSCVSSMSIMHYTPDKPALEVEKAPKINPSQVAVSIILPDNKGTLNAEVNKPSKKAESKTLIILVPGSGKVSRRGEIDGDGIDNYAAAIEQNNLWANSLAEQGFFVMAYDKRTCDSNLCHKNPTKDIDEQGIKALSGDLDAVYKWVSDKLAAEGERARVFLMTTNQGAQVVAQAECAKLVQGIILLSPIIGSLQDALMGGYTRAQGQKIHPARKNRLLNKAEEIKALFLSLNKKGMFPDNAQVRGASLTFWHSWMAASLSTLDMLVVLKRPILALFSAQDVFSAQDKMINNNKYKLNKRNLSVKSIHQTDRNFISDGHLSPIAINEVADFIKKSK